MQKIELDLVFSALADPTRRGMLAQLAQGETNVGALAESYAMSQPAISKHVRVLEKAGLIKRKKHGRQHLIRVNPQPIEEAQSWIGQYARFWKSQFDAVDAYLEAKKMSDSERENP
ncbi:helix-turn-helix transcriptional regulator [Parvularcula sp. IMCC14364]|uniref:ArsR/SmtB family transcription factor n=1 Tax=Parvularcula sp. IMCC14364 TaxID=3067902 RepID=UPI00274102FE|nr:metalloregulator ArsR/SmtB family transcription factor [Parvularcula sp. IMCC14364]